MTITSYVTKKDDKDFTYYLKKPTSKDYQEAKLYSNRLAAEITQQKTKEGKPGFILRSQVGNLLMELGVWTESTQKELLDTSKSLIESERKLAKGGAAGLTKSQGRALSLEIAKLRAKQYQLLTKTREMDHLTLEAQVENANFDYLVANCLLDEEGKCVFKDVEDYRENGGEAWVTDAAEKLAAILYGVDEDRTKNLPENKFLLKYGFMNDKFQLIDKDGNLVNEDGKRIDKEGYLVNDQGERIDTEGNRLDENGDIIQAFEEFLDD